ncbi:MAG: NAD(P)H-hydrate dehydratase [Candidatus Omnitrophota bacterium]
MRLPARLLHRKKYACKNDFGRVFILAGSANMLGAAALAAKAALRSGCGLVTVGVADKLNSTLQKKLPDEVMTRPLAQTAEGTISSTSFSQISDILKRAEVLAMGPGLSRNPSTQKLIRRLAALDMPMVIDADALNALAEKLKVLRAACSLKPAAKIITPHPGEMARLLGITAQAVQQQRKTIALGAAKKYNSIVILKGHRTVVAAPGGKLYINQTGNPGMATAGSGDVLTGMVAALLAQGIEGFQAAKTAVYLHGIAGDLAAREKTQAGMIASDIIEKIPAAIKKAN